MADERDSNPRAAQLRLEASGVHATAGQRKHDLRIGPQPDYVDSDRSPLNRVLVKSLTATIMKARAIERRNRQPRIRKMRSDASVSMRGIITFGHEAQVLFEALSPSQQDAAFLELAQKVADRLKVDLTGLAVHLDETAIHAHFQIDSYDTDGNSLSDLVKREQLRQLQTLTYEVMSAHCPGIERGQSKLVRLKNGAQPKDVVNKRPAQLRRELVREINGLTYAIDTKRDEEARLQKRIDKLTTLGDELTEKGAQQLATAERRLAAKQAEITELERQAAEATEKAQRGAQRAAKAASEETDIEKRLGPARAAVAALDAHAAAEAERQAQERERAEQEQKAELARECARQVAVMASSDPVAAAVTAFALTDGYEAEREQYRREFGISKGADMLEAQRKVKQAFEKDRDLSDRFKFSHWDSLPYELKEYVSLFEGAQHAVRGKEKWPDFRRSLPDSLRSLLRGVVSYLRETLLNAQWKPAPPPPEAASAVEMPEQVREAVRQSMPSTPHPRSSRPDDFSPS